MPTSKVAIAWPSSVELASVTWLQGGGSNIRQAVKAGEVCCVRPSYLSVLVGLAHREADPLLFSLLQENDDMNLDSLRAGHIHDAEHNMELRNQMRREGDPALATRFVRTSQY